MRLVRFDPLKCSSIVEFFADRAIAMSLFDVTVLLLHLKLHVLLQMPEALLYRQSAGSAARRVCGP